MAQQLLALRFWPLGDVSRILVSVASNSLIANLVKVLNGSLYVIFIEMKHADLENNDMEYYTNVIYYD